MSWSLLGAFAVVVVDTGSCCGVMEMDSFVEGGWIVGIGFDTQHWRMGMVEVVSGEMAEVTYIDTRCVGS